MAGSSLQQQIASMRQSLFDEADEPLDVTELGKFLQQLRGNCLGIGAKKVLIEVEKMLQCHEAGDMEGTKTILPTMKQEYNILENKLEVYFELLPHIAPGQSSDPPSKGSTSGGE
nr:pseudo histidine-containing phosphotransfer protein 5-like [Quercus suber]